MYLIFGNNSNNYLIPPTKIRFGIKVPNFCVSCASVIFLDCSNIYFVLYRIKVELFFLLFCEGKSKWYTQIQYFCDAKYNTRILYT